MLVYGFAIVFDIVFSISTSLIASFIIVVVVVVNFTLYSLAASAMGECFYKRY